MIVDIEYRPHLSEIASWLEANVGKTEGHLSNGGLYGCGWELYYTTKGDIPYVITRCELRSRKSATLFALRWS